MMKFLQAVTLLAFLFSDEITTQTINLNGTWNGYILSPSKIPHLPSENGVYFNATVPGGVYTDLVRARILWDNLVGDNDVRNRWVGNMSFAFTTNFQLNESLLLNRNLTLIFHGIDTFANIFVNDKLVGKTSNMFLRYTFDVMEYAQDGNNELKVVIFSPVQKANKLYEEQSLKYVVPPQCPPKEYNGICHVNHIRKMQASFAWDWGPAFPSIGIWKTVELRPLSTILLTDVTVAISKTHDFWEVVVTAFFETTVSGREDTETCHIYAHIGGYSNWTDAKLSMNGRTTNASLLIRMDDMNIERWWPNGYGNQTLYSLSVEVSTAIDRESRDFNVGFRTVELVQEPLTRGLTFYLKVNDVPIFAKGSNWIPSSVFPELSADEQTVRQLLKSAKDAHMNMLRVWGGGYYESDLFYQLADEYGIMIWQDFMFACAMYPSNEEFLESVRLEVQQNVRRLQHHPSVALWAGNNENEVAIYGNWYGTGDAEVYKQDYVKLYVDVVKDEVERNDPTRPFVVSSPSDGLLTENSNYLGPDPYSNLYGDVHYYNYVNNGWDINHYPRTRFASEYGVQSIPSIQTLAAGTINTEDLRLQSAFMKHRQHLVAGYESMEFLVSKNLKMPETKNATTYFTDYIYLTQINQAVSIKVETEFYRQAKSTLNTAGEGMTMGALYWQLNDIWHAPSWSSIEFGGRWKMLHYYAKDFFAPVIVTPHVSVANELELYVISDLLTDIKKCSVDMNIYEWSSGSRLYTQNIGDFTIPSNTAEVVAKFWLDEYLQRVDCLAFKKTKCVVEFVLRDAKGEPMAPYNYVYPALLKTVDLPVANISVIITEISEKDYNIELRSDSIALFVWMEVGGDIKGRFSENGFHIFHRVRMAVFHSEEATTVEMIRNSFFLTTLSDIYNRDGNSRHSVTVQDVKPQVILI